MSKLSSAFELVRPINCTFTGAAVLIGAIVTFSGLDLPKGAAIMAFAAAALVAAGGYSVNDYFDREIDKVNRPWRPIPSGRMRSREALVLAQALFILGVVLAILLNPYCFSLATLNSLVLVLYSWKLKRMGLAGNLSIGYLVGSTFLFGGLAVETLGGGILVLVFMAASSTVGRELIKGIEDMRGDRKLGFRTFPLQHGTGKTAALAVGFIVAAVIVSPLPYALGVFGWAYLFFVFPSIAIFTCAGVIIARDQKQRSARVSSLACKIGMGLGLLAFLMGAIVKMP